MKIETSGEPFSEDKNTTYTKINYILTYLIPSLLLVASFGAGVIFMGKLEAIGYSGIIIEMTYLACATFGLTISLLFIGLLWATEKRKILKNGSIITATLFGYRRDNAKLRRYDYCYIYKFTDSYGKIHYVRDLNQYNFGMHQKSVPELLQPL